MSRSLDELTAADYASALKALQLSDTRKAMLKAHYRSPGRALSARQMGQQRGWDMPTAANMHYGRLGGAIANQLRVRGTGPVHTMVTFINSVDSASGEVLWVMRPQLAKALERLQLVTPRKAGKAPVKAYVGSTGDPIATAFEGAKQVQWRNHRRREWKLRQAKIAETLAQSGKLRCEVPRCGFDFEAVYGELGQGFAEVHHTRPLSRRPGDRATTLSELVIVCANCHAMIHRGGACRALPGLRRRR